MQVFRSACQVSAPPLPPRRADIAFALEELAKSTTTPTNGDLALLKRLARYLSGRPGLQITHQRQEAQNVAIGYTDADWAGDREARRLRSEGCIVIGSRLVNGWAKPRSLIALSSGESELYAALRASSETFGLMTLARDMGFILKGSILGDASAALGIIHRKGVGRTRHIDTSYLWVQQVVAQRRLVFSKVRGKDNPADLYTE